MPLSIPLSNSQRSTSFRGRLRRAFYRLMQAGTAGYDHETKRRLSITNLTGYLASISSLTYAATYALEDFHELKWVALVNAVSAIITLLLPLLHRFGSLTAVTVLVSSVFAALMYYVSVLGRDSGIQLNYVSASAVAFVVLGLRRMHLVSIMITTGLTLTIIAHLLFKVGSAQPNLDEQFINGLYIQSICSCMFIIGFVVWYSFRVAANAEERSEQLLRNILPDEIAERLKAEPDQLIADRFEEASVLFADLVGFTPLSKQLAPRKLIELLNDIFTRFDDLAHELDIEKIKTIGDAYMAVCGIPLPKNNHAERTIELAIGMQRAITEVSKTRNISLGIRIGIASGSITAGVIGKAKFAYDVWAPTVNLAARLESYGEPGKIHVSDETKFALDERFEFQEVPIRHIKGVGKLRTWFLVGT